MHNDPLRSHDRMHAGPVSNTPPHARCGDVERRGVGETKERCQCRWRRKRRGGSQWSSTHAKTPASERAPLPPLLSLCPLLLFVLCRWLPVLCCPVLFRAAARRNGQGWPQDATAAQLSCTRTGALGKGAGDTAEKTMRSPSFSVGLPFALCQHPSHRPRQCVLGGHPCMSASQTRPSILRLPPGMPLLSIAPLYLQLDSAAVSSSARRLPLRQRRMPFGVGCLSMKPQQHCSTASCHAEARRAESLGCGQYHELWKDTVISG
jgi:hypothetical protein